MQLDLLYSLLDAELKFCRFGYLFPEPRNLGFGMPWVYILTRMVCKFHPVFDREACLVGRVFKEDVIKR